MGARTTFQCDACASESTKSDDFRVINIGYSIPDPNSGRSTSFGHTREALLCMVCLGKIGLAASFWREHASGEETTPQWLVVGNDKYTTPQMLGLAPRGFDY